MKKYKSPGPRLINTMIFLLLAAQLTAQIRRERIPMDNDWRFQLGDAADPVKDFNFGLSALFSKSGKTDGTGIDPLFKDSSWRRLNLPHDWAVELPFVNSPAFDVMAHGYKPVGKWFPSTSVGWYRKHFMIQAADSGKRFRISFDGIFRDSRIWLNGFYLGNHASGYTGVSYDITDYLRYDQENVLVVRADASLYEGWFYEGAGIYRHVWLDSYAPVHIAEHGIYARTRIDGSKASVDIETTIANEDAGRRSPQLTTELLDREGRILATQTSIPTTLAAGISATVRQKITLANPKPWSPDSPYLYRLRCRITQNGRTIDAQTIRIGIRNIDIRPNGLFVNGKYTKIKGVNIHQDHAGVGSAMPDQLQYYRIQLLKQMGVNAYRTSHHPPTPELLDACDSLGLLVLDENRLVNSSPEYMADWEWLIRRDRSRASVFCWSIGNEEGFIQTTATGKAIAATLLRRQQQLDPSRTATYAADLPNVFHGINEVIPVRGFNYRVAGIDPYHKDHPGQPIMGTEMGSTVTTRGIYTKDTIRCYVPDEDITAPWWASRAEEWWPAAADRTWWMGGFIWTGFDYRGEPTPYQWPNINSHFGVMDVCGFPKNLYYYYQSWWSGQDVLHISPHWNWKGQEGRNIDVWVNSNAERVELFLNGKSLGEKQMPRNSHLQWQVPYSPGRLSAIGWRNGKKLETAVETTGAAEEVVLTPYKTTLAADGKDISVINISVTDKEGREVPDAGNLIRFSLRGDARIIGVGNGDPSSHEPDQCPDSAWQRKLFNGKCQIIVQAGRTNGLVSFTASSEGLRPGSTDIYTVNASTPHRVVKGTEPNWQPARPISKMMGADISFLPELEHKGIHFSDHDTEKDAIGILKKHGFNYIRLRIFNNPASADGYSPNQGFCDLAHTLQMARRVKNAGLKLLLDFHYSDTWADPGKQFKPAAWKGLDFRTLQDSVSGWTIRVMKALKDQGTLPDMVQIGNEINHGMIWPEGRIDSPDSLAALIYAGIKGAKSVDPRAIIMLHIALGGQNAESHFFLDNMLQRGVPFDVIGLSYYPKWHGTLTDLQFNSNDLAQTYQKDVIVVEYTQLKKAVNKIAFSIPDGRGKGTCIWEPLNTWEQVFDEQGRSNQLLPLYDEISREYLHQ